MAKIELPRVRVAIKGEAKTGKTHLALTWPKPMIVFSFNTGIKRVLPKFKGQEIDIKTYTLPLMTTAPGNFDWAMPLWAKFYEKDFQPALESKQYATFVIDTGSDCYDVCRYAYREERGFEKVNQRNYEEINARMSSILMAPDYYDINLVTTNHVKPVYIDGNDTGDTKLDGPKETEGLVDVVIETSIGRSDGKNFVNGTITKCGWDFNLNGTALTNPTYEDLMAVLFTEG